MLKELICKGHCAYFKPSGPDDLACGGYLLLERLAAEKRVPAWRNLKKVPPGLGLPLALILCPACPYYREDCDFAAGVDAPPCGGFVVIASLLREGHLHIDEVMRLL